MSDRISEIQNYIQCDTTITCGEIGPNIVDKLQSITGILNSLPQQAWTTCGDPEAPQGSGSQQTAECIRANLLDGYSGATDMMNEMKDRISDIQNYIDDRC